MTNVLRLPGWSFTAGFFLGAGAALTAVGLYLYQTFKTAVGDAS